MAASVVTISEFAGMGPQLGGAQATMGPPIVDQVVVASVSSAQSAPFNALTRMIRLHAKVNACIAFGANPIATVNNFSMAANQTEYIRVNPGDIVAVIGDP